MHQPGNDTVHMLPAGWRPCRVAALYAFAFCFSPPWGCISPSAHFAHCLLQVGQAVASNGAAAFAEYAIAQAAMCTPLAPGTPLDQATAITLSALTACAALEGTARVAPGEAVAVTAASGGAGHFAVQLAVLAGARVVAFTSSAKKAEALRGLQAAPELVIDTRWVNCLD